MSPAFATSTGTCCLPIKVTILPHFSSTSRVTLYNLSPTFSSPEKTRTKLCLPANGSNIVLNTKPVNGLSATTICSSLESTPIAVITFFVASGI